MRTLSLLSIIILSVLASFGQTERQYISLAVGPSFTLDDFGRTDISDSTSGWAKTGVALEFTYAYRITHNFGIQLQVNYSGNKFDNFAYRDALDAAYSLDPNSPDTAFVVESASNWSSGGMLFGPYLRFPLSESLSWDIRATAGFYGASSPDITIKANTTSGGKLEDYFHNGGKGYAFAYSVGTGFKYALSKYYLMLFANYYKTSVQIKDVSGWDWNTEPYETSFKQDIGYISLTFGVGYFF